MNSSPSIPMNGSISLPRAFCIRIWENRTLRRCRHNNDPDPSKADTATNERSPRAERTIELKNKQKVRTTHIPLNTPPGQTDKWRSVTKCYTALASLFACLWLQHFASCLVVRFVVAARDHTSFLCQWKYKCSCKNWEWKQHSPCWCWTEDNVCFLNDSLYARALEKHSAIFSLHFILRHIGVPLSHWLCFDVFVLPDLWFCP